MESKLLHPDRRNSIRHSTQLGHQEKAFDCRRDRMVLSSSRLILLFCVSVLISCAIIAFRICERLVVNEELSGSSARKAVKDDIAVGMSNDSSEQLHKVVVNSARWLDETRINNIDEGNILTDDILTGLIFPGGMDTGVSEHGARVALERTICHENSPFRTWATPSSSEAPTSDPWMPLSEDERLDQRAEYDAVRLMYLAIHENQHAPARNEVISRAIVGRPWNVGTFDFECPDAKFIVTWLQDNGLGGVIRLKSVEPVLLGVATGRVTLFLNNGPHLPSVGKNKWKLASCERYDHQCFFMPMSPCVITEEELRAAPILTDTDVDRARLVGRFDAKYDNERVIVVPHNRETFPPLPAGLREAMYRAAMSFYNNNNNNTNFSNPKLRHFWTMDQDRLERACNVILNEQDRWRPTYAVIAYNLRPNLGYQQRMNSRIDELIPKDFNPNRALGLPIRSSDMCVGNDEEKTCLAFEDYVQIAIAFSKKEAESSLESLIDHANNSFRMVGLEHDSIIITSESQQMLDAAVRYGTNGSTPFVDVILNGMDVAQGTGAPFHFSDRTRTSEVYYTADDVMFSTMIAMRMQLQAKDIVGNCCSTFHMMVKDLILSGCGAASFPTFHCQHEENGGHDCITRIGHVSN